MVEVVYTCLVDGYDSGFDETETLIKCNCNRGLISLILVIICTDIGSNTFVVHLVAGLSVLALDDSCTLSFG